MKRKKDCRDKLYKLLEDQMIEPYEVIDMCIKWMGEAEVEAMMKSRNLVDWEYDEEPS